MKKSFLIAYTVWQFGEGYITILFTFFITSILLSSPEALGQYQTAFLVPGLALLLVGGALSDKFGGFGVAISAKFIYVFSTVVVMWFLASRDLAPVEVVLFAISIGSASAIGGPAIDSLIPLVGNDNVSKMAVWSSAAHYIGKFLGSVVLFWISALNVLVAFAVHVFAMIVAAALLLRIWSAHKAVSTVVPPIETNNTNPTYDSVFWRSFFSNRLVVLSVTVQGLLGFFNIPVYFVSMPLALRGMSESDASSIAIMGICYWTGCIVAAYILIILKNRSQFDATTILVSALILDGVCLAGISSTNDIILALALFGLHGAASGAALAMTSNVLLSNASEAMRGRLVALFQLALWGVVPISTILLGQTFARLGSQAGLLLSAGGMMLGAFLVALAMHSLRKAERLQ